MSSVHPLLLSLYFLLTLSSFFVWYRTYYTSKKPKFSLSLSFRKTLISISLWFLTYYLMGLAGTIAYYRFPRFPGNDKYPEPLPDIFFEFVPEVCPKVFGQNIQSLILIIFYTYLTLLILPFHSHGLKILRHFLILNSLMFLTRSTTVSITSLPQPNYTPKCLYAQNATSTFSESFNIVMLSGFPPKSCGDLIYSGHASCAILSMLIFEYHKCYFSYQKILRPLGWGLVGIAIVSIFTCRSHYGVDVILAGYFSFGLFGFFKLRVEGGEGFLSEELKWLAGGEEKVREEGSGVEFLKNCKNRRRRNTGEATGERESLVKGLDESSETDSSVENYGGTTSTNIISANV